MFIYTVRGSTVRYFAVIALSLVLLVAIILAGANADRYAAASTQIDFSGVKSEEDRIAFIERCGYKVKDGWSDSVTFTVPENFDRLILGYNEIQKAQGLDITKYKNKKVTRYTYEVTNYEGYDGVVYANIIVYRNTVVACDISTAEKDGFVKPLFS